jgi:hypothetical protein
MKEERWMANMKRTDVRYLAVRCIAWLGLLSHIAFNRSGENSSKIEASFAVNAGKRKCQDDLSFLRFERCSDC